MSDQTQSALRAQRELATEITLSSAGRAILRGWATRVAERALRPIEQEEKDHHTIRNDPRRVIRWVEIARQEAKAL